MTTARFPVRIGAGCGTIHPSRQPRSTICNSICRMLTAGALMPSVQEASQVAGQILPVTSGRLLVAWSRSSARRHWPRQIMSFQSGMRLCSGQPKVWQYGTPQSMQRPA